MVDFPLVQGKAQQGAHVVDAVSPGGTGVEVHDTQTAVHHHFQDVRMSADEQRGGSGEEFLLHVAVVVSGITSDVFEQDLHPFFDKAKPLGECSADFSAVGIAINGTKGSHGREAFSDGHRADVARMPYLVGFPGVAQDGRIEGAVGIGEQKYFLHRV